MGCLVGQQTWRHAPVTRTHNRRDASFYSLGFEAVLWLWQTRTFLLEQQSAPRT